MSKGKSKRKFLTENLQKTEPNNRKIQKMSQVLWHKMATIPMRTEYEVVIYLASKNKPSRDLVISGYWNQILMGFREQILESIQKHFMMPKFPTIMDNLYFLQKKFEKQIPELRMQVIERDTNITFEKIVNCQPKKPLIVRTRKEAVKIRFQPIRKRPIQTYEIKYPNQKIFPQRKKNERKQTLKKAK